MKTDAIPCCYTPSKIIAIDDNADFLESLGLVLPSHYIGFYRAYEALDYINNHYNESIYDRHHIKTIEENLDSSSINIEIKKIHLQIYNPERFNEVSLLVVDYAMPGMKGLELLKQVRHTNIKRLLLTGEATTDIAVDAFNDQVINYFILKQDPKNLNKLIVGAQRDYYCDISNHLINSSIDCLQDPVFIELFNKICEQHAIVEYYLLDNQGSFLLLNKSAVPFWLIIKDEDTMEGYREMAELSDAPNSVISALKIRTHLPYFYSDEDMNSSPSVWDNFMHPAKLLEGNKRYYYSILNNPEKYPLHTDKILSYKNYLKQKI